MSEKRKAKKEAKKAKKIDKKSQKLEKKELKKAGKGKNKSEDPADLETISYIAEGFCGEDDRSDLNWHIDEDGTLYITGNGYMSDYISDPHFTRPWSKYSDVIRTVYIEAGVRYIGDFAFHGLYNLIGFGVAPESKYFCSVDGVLFNKDMTELIRYPLAGEAEYIVPDTVIELSDYAFADCQCITSVTIPETVISIGHHVFSYCRNLISADGGLGIRSIPDHAFEGCSSIQRFDVWVNVISVGNYAFLDCNSLESLCLGRHVREIGLGLIDICPKFKGFNVDIENPYFKSDEGILFSKNGSMLIKYPAVKNDSSYIIPRKVKDIAESSFSGNKTLSSVVFPNDLKSIGRYAFVGCPALNIRDLPQNLIYKGEFITG